MARALPGDGARATREGFEIIEEGLSRGESPATIANRFHRAIINRTGNKDPYLDAKLSEIEFARAAAPGVTGRFPRELGPLITLAALGNTLDFFRDHQEVERDLAGDISFARDQREELAERLSENPSLVLFLADNAGEPFFDLPLMKHLGEMGHRALYAVKGGPAQNDVTLEDLARTGVRDMFPEVVSTGARTVGLVHEECSEGFLALYARADVIIAKGMGHVETLYEANDPRIFHLVMAKCPPVARYLGVAKGQFVAAFQPGAE